MILMISWVWVHFRLDMTTKDACFPCDVPAYVIIKVTADVWVPHWPGRLSTSLDGLAASSASHSFGQCLPDGPRPDTLKTFIPRLTSYSQVLSQAQLSLTVTGKSHPLKPAWWGVCGSVELASGGLLRSPTHP